MPKKKKAAVIEDIDYSEKTVHGIGPDVNFDTLPQAIVNGPNKNVGLGEKKVIDHNLVRAGVKDPFIPSVPLDNDTAIQRGGDGNVESTFNSGTRAEVNKKSRSPFISNAPVKETKKTILDNGTSVDRM